MSAFLDREFIPAVERAKPRAKGFDEARLAEALVRGRAEVEQNIVAKMASLLAAGDITTRDAIHEDGRAAAEAVAPEVPACRECERPGSVSGQASRRHGPRCRYFDRGVA